MMKRSTIPILCLCLSLAACGGDESFDPGLWGGGKADQAGDQARDQAGELAPSGALPNCGNATTYPGEFGDCGDTYATAARPQPIVDNRVDSNSASDQDSIQSPDDVDYWVIGMKDMPTQQFSSGDLLQPWVHASIASSKTQLGNYRRADPSLKVEVCIYYKWNSGFSGNGGCFGGQEQTVDGVTACCAVVEQATAGRQALLSLPNVARSVMPDSGELVIRVSASSGSDGCGVYHVTWGTRVDSTAYLTKANSL